MKLHLIAVAATAIAMPAAVSAQTMTPAEFVKTAGASDLYETRSSEAVDKTTRNPKVKAFAQQMIADHAKNTAQVKAAAAKSGVKAAPPALDAKQASQVAQLNAETGTKRDTTYIAQQKTAHDQALSVHKSYAASGTAPALKTAAAGIAPVVQHHIDMLKTM